MMGLSLYAVLDKAALLHCHQHSSLTFLDVCVGTQIFYWVY